MPTDSDLDDQLRAAMKTLDDEVPSGYFEALPDLTLARLEGTMQHGTQGTTENVSAVPPPAAENTEDSGLHDIRNLAQSAKQRLSSRRIGTIPPVSEDDLIASSSAGFKAVALPQPAKMVALPELSELPSKKEVLAKEKAAAVKVEKAAAPVEAAPAAALAREPSFSLPSAQKKNKKGVIAIVGLGLAAAAGAAIFVSTQKSASKAEGPALAQEATTRTAAPVATAPAAAPATGSAAISGDVQKAEDEVAKAEADAAKMKAELAAAQAAAPAGGEGKAADVPTKTPPKTAKGHGGKTQVVTPTQKVDETKPAPDKGKDTKKADAGKTGSGDAEPDFNDLLKEAGVKEPQQKKPVLDKKELTGDDFKKAMAAVTTKAQGCYKGTQGTATVKLTIAPSGQIAKVAVGGQFAGTPEGQCVANAIKAASFPPWDGHPASFTYPILLSE